MSSSTHRRTRRFAAVCSVVLAVGTVGCGTDDALPSAKSASVAVSTVAATPGDRVFVLPETDELSLLDSQRASTQDQSPGLVLFTFASSGSPDDDVDGPRVMFGVGDATDIPSDDVIADGKEIAVGDRSFRWVADTEDQRVYVGSTPLGSAIAMATLNVEEATAVGLLAVAELSDGAVLFDGDAVPDGWVDTGTSATLLQFVAGSTGSSTPIGGTRTLYGDPASAATPSWDSTNDGFGVTLATWPVTGIDPDAEARYSLDGEVDVQVRLADGSGTIGYASPSDTEFFEFIVWQDGNSWLALSRPAIGGTDALADLAATVREASVEEAEQLQFLQEN